MPVLQRVYDWTMKLAENRHALLALFFVAFIESSFFPIPPDVLIIPMVLAARSKAWRIAAVCSVGSVLGGLFGYAIGFYLFEAVGQPLLAFYHAAEKFDTFTELYNEYGAWIVAIAGFSPIPYKVFTIASGVANLDVMVFTVASAVSRSARFFLEAGLLWYFGAPIRAFIEQHLGKVTLAFVALGVGGFLLVKVIL